MRFESSCAIRRIGPSTAPPGENGTTMRIGRAGYACARTIELDSAHAAASAASLKPAAKPPEVRAVIAALAAGRRGKAAQVRSAGKTGAFLDQTLRALRAEDRIDQTVKFAPQIGVAHRMLKAADRVFDPHLQRSAVRTPYAHVRGIFGHR